MFKFMDKPWPALEELMKEVTAKADQETHEQNLSLTGKPLKGDQPLYYAHSTISGETKQVFATEEEVLSGG